MAQSVSDAAARLKTLEDSWGSIAAKDVNWLSDFNQCKRMIVALVRSARTSIHYSTFLCDVNFSLALDGSPSPTFAELLRDAVARGVQVKICYNPESCYGNASEADFVRDLAGCEIRSVRSSLAPAPWMMYFSNNTKFGYVCEALVRELLFVIVIAILLLQANGQPSRAACAICADGICRVRALKHVAAGLAAVL